MNYRLFVAILSNFIFFCILLYMLQTTVPSQSTRPLLFFGDNFFHENHMNKSKLKPRYDLRDAKYDFKETFDENSSGSGSEYEDSEEETLNHINISIEEIDSEEEIVDHMNIEVMETKHKMNMTEPPNGEFYRFSEDTKVKIWIDIPNAFPWRHCLMKWNHGVDTVSCEFNNKDLIKLQTFHVKLHKSDKSKFYLMIDDKLYCVVPATTRNTLRSFRNNPECEEDEYWRWDTISGQMRFSNTGKCVTSTGYGKNVIVENCSEDDKESQIVEFGVLVDAHGFESSQPCFDANKSKIKKRLFPISGLLWNQRMERLRSKELNESLIAVQKVLEEIKNMNKSGELSRISGSRRAVVFYVDKTDGFLAYLNWWLYSWKLIGLNASSQAFDIILFTHPESVNKLPEECKEISESFNPEAPGPGLCLYRKLKPLSERNFKYDNYLNSQECLSNRNTSQFLLKYRILIRADLDTFPTPRLIDYWPSDVVCNRNAMTTHHMKNIEEAIRNTSAAAGILHHHWHNTDSAWMGPSIRVIMLAKLTVQLARFTRVHMFGPGTRCRCDTCTELPCSCTWGRGIYAGTLLLYAQEIAMNLMWTQREYDAMTYAILDGSCTDVSVHICKPALLHARHNSELFSKFTFLRDEYKNFDMSRLDITNVRDWATFLALSSSGQGVNGEVAWSKYLNKTGNTKLRDLCKP